jgi:hypothetical protein
MPVPIMFATTMQVAVKTEIVRADREEVLRFTGDHLVAKVTPFNRDFSLGNRRTSFA